jgi:hypothetical protein
MSKKKKRKGQRPTHAPQGGKSRFSVTYVFIALIILGILAVVLAEALSGGPPVDCPPGLVWSDDHNHCH